MFQFCTTSAFSRTGSDPFGWIREESSLIHSGLRGLSGTSDETRKVAKKKP